jgi:hypothetical protein
MTAIAILISAYVLLAIDWAQTLRIAREPERYREAWNLVLPEHPSVAQVHTWFAGVALIVGLALWQLPDLRVWIAIAGGAVEAACVVNNYRRGLKP